MLREAVSAASPSGFRTPARHVALSTALWNALARWVLCACARPRPPYSLGTGTAGTTWLRGGGRKGRAENVDQMGVAWRWGRSPGPEVEGAPPRRPRAFLVFAVALAEFKGRSGVGVTA